MLKRHPLLFFFILTFVITWGLGASTLLFGEKLYTFFGEFGPGNPIYHIAVYAPAISAFAMIGLMKGRGGILAYLRRLLHWKVGVRWYLLVLVGIPAVYLCARVLSHFIIGTPLAYPISPWYLAVPTALWMMIYIPGAMEEIGWRGFALPLLQARYSALRASLILGLIWAIWHLPAFFMVAYYQEGGKMLESLSLFILWASVVSVLMTTIYNGTMGSIPIAILAHWMFNDPYQLRNYPADTLIVTAIFSVIAIIAILATGHKNLGRAKWTEVLPSLPEELDEPAQIDEKISGETTATRLGMR